MQRQKTIRRFSTLGICRLLLAVLACTASLIAEGVTDYLPLQIGNKWTYYIPGGNVKYRTESIASKEKDEFRVINDMGVMKLTFKYLVRSNMILKNDDPVLKSPFASNIVWEKTFKSGFTRYQIVGNYTNSITIKNHTFTNYLIVEERSIMMLSPNDNSIISTNYKYYAQNVGLILMKMNSLFSEPILEIFSYEIKSNTSTTDETEAISYLNKHISGNYITTISDGYIIFKFEPRGLASKVQMLIVDARWNPSYNEVHTYTFTDDTTIEIGDKIVMRIQKDGSLIGNIADTQNIVFIKTGK